MLMKLSNCKKYRENFTLIESDAQIKLMVSLLIYVIDLILWPTNVKQILL